MVEVIKNCGFHKNFSGMHMPFVDFSYNVKIFGIILHSVNMQTSREVFDREFKKYAKGKQ